jgi:hypothetical protein
VAIKQDRPVNFGDDGIVVYVAKSVAGVDKARAALLEGGVPIDLPEAAVAALFAAGRESLPIRVPAMHFKKASGIIEEVFPPPVIDLPPLPDEEEDASGGGSSGGGGKSGGSGGGGGTAEMDRFAPQAKAGLGQHNPAKVAESATKTVFIALASLLLPIVGVFLAAFAGYSAWWCMERLSLGSSGRTKAKIALGLSIGAGLWNIGVGIYAVWFFGLLDKI